MAERVKPHDPLTVEEYLQLEESATVRHEYVAGEIFAMVGATKRHNRIVGNTYATLWGTARGGNRRVYSESVKLRVSDDVIYYPDLVDEGSFPSPCPETNLSLARIYESIE